MFKETGVYIIENINNGKCYIGSTLVNFHSRFTDHLGDLRRGKHHSLKLQRSFNKHGESSFKFRILEVCENARHVEQKWLDKMKPFYNMTLTVGNIDNHVYETKLKISNIRGGKPIDICDIEDNVLKTVNLQKEAAEFVGGNQSKVWRCLHGITNTHKGYRFKHSGEDFKYTKKSREHGGMLNKKHSEETRTKKMPISMARGKFKGVLEVFKNGTKIEEFLSLKECSDKLNIKTRGISNSIKSGKKYKGYTFNKNPLVADSPVSGIERGFKENNSGY